MVDIFHTRQTENRETSKQKIFSLFGGIKTLLEINSPDKKIFQEIKQKILKLCPLLNMDEPKRKMIETMEMTHESFISVFREVFPEKV